MRAVCRPNRRTEASHVRRTLTINLNDRSGGPGEERMKGTHVLLTAGIALAVVIGYDYYKNKRG